MELAIINTLQSVAATLACEKAGIPSILCIRESQLWRSFYRFLPPKVANLSLSCLRLPRNIIFTANSTLALWSDFELVKRTLIYNALNEKNLKLNSPQETDILRQKFGGSDEVVFLCVGTLCSRKGQIDILDAASHINKQLEVPVRFILVGGAETKYAYRIKKRLPHINKLSKVSISLVPPTKNIAELYMSSDVFSFDLS